MAQTLKWRSSDESLDFYRRSLQEPLGPTPVIFPFKTLWEFGGFARVVTPGVMIMVVGMAGGMKTALLECLTDAWRQQDFHDVLWWGTEWTWQQMSDRAIQRYGGPTIDEKALHTLWLHEEKMGVEPERRSGVRLAKVKIEAGEKANDIIRSWPGMTHMLEEAVSDVDTLMEAGRQRIKELHDVGREVKFFVWDYLQLMSMMQHVPENERLSLIMGKMQNFCFEQQIIGIAASQVTKSSSFAAKKEDQTLSAEDAQNTRSDKPKLILTLRPAYRGGLITNRAVIRVDKNNAGRTGEKTLLIDPAHFRWIDQEAT